MKVGIDAKRAFCNKRGLGNHSRTLINALLKHNKEIELCLFTPKMSYFDESWIEDRERVSIIMPKLLKFGFLSSLWRTFCIGPLAKKLKVDLFHGPSHELPLFLSRKIKTVVTVHDLLYITSASNFHPIDRFTYDKKVRYALKRADKVVAITEQTKRDLVKYLHVLEDDVTVVYQSISSSFWNESQRGSPSFVLPANYFLYVGGFERNKNLLNLIRAFSKLAAQRDAVQLLLVGGGNSYYVGEMKTLISSLRLDSQIQILEGISNNVLPTIYSNAKGLILPSFYEGFGLPIVEAMALNIPVITTDRPCFYEAGGDAAYYVDTTNHDVLSQAMIRVLDDVQFREEQIEKGKSHSQKFREELFAYNMTKIYQSLMNSITDVES